MRDTVRQKTSRDGILDAAELLLGRNGYKKMTIDELAREVGIGKGSVYLHFESKEEIALAHIDRIIERLKSRLANIAGSRGSCEKRLKAMLIERVLFRFDSVQHYTQNLNDMLAHIRPKLLERRTRYFEQEVRIFSALIAEGTESGVFGRVRPAQAAETVIHATNSFLPFSLTAQELGDRRELERKVTRVAEMLLKGLCKREKE